MHGAFEVLDYVVIATYLLAITAIGIYAGFRRHASSEQYFLASKSLGWFTVGAAVFASNISTIHLVGLAASGANEGLVVGNFEWMACYTLILLALVLRRITCGRGSPPCPSSWKSVSARRRGRSWPSSASWRHC